MLLENMMRLALLSLLASIATACSRYEVAPGYESVARTPPPPECSDRPATLTTEAGTDSTLSSATVAGIIVNEHRRPIEGAQVSLLPDSVLRTVTDSAGRFRFADAREGTYRLVVRRIGYNPVDTVIPVPATSRQMYRIVLPARTFDGPCAGVVVVVKKPWWKWW
jgi:hypothetical protein